MKDRIFIIIIIIIGGAIYSSYKKKNLIDNLVYTECKVVNFEHSSKTYFYVNYSFLVKKKKYTGSVSTSFFKCSNSVKGCKGEVFKVGYSSKDPNINEIDLGIYNKFKTSINSIFPR